MSYVNNAEDVLAIIDKFKGIGTVKNHTNRITSGYLADVVCRVSGAGCTDFDEDENKEIIYNYTALIYPTMAGSLSVVHSDGNDLYLCGMEDLHMSVCVDVEDYMAVFNKTSVGGPDTTFRITKITKF